jgi:hypothetical protein
MKGAKAFVIFFIASSLLSARTSSSGPSLIRIGKNDGPAWNVIRRFRIDIRQELGTCFLALAGTDEIRRLRANDLKVRVLDRQAKNREYLLVPLHDAGDITALQALGNAVSVEAGTAVFWTESGRPADVLPAGLPRKPLSSLTLLPFIEPPAPSVQSARVAPSDRDPLVDLIAARVREERLRSDVQSLQNFGTRYFATGGCEAAGEFIRDSFQTAGLDEVRIESFVFSGAFVARNVIAEKTGATYPADVLIICAHYDSTSPSATRLTLAPGADDNASGTAAVLEAARILAAFPLDFTVRFIAFSAEEEGLYGSRDYAMKARANGENIIGVLNCDMIAYADAMPEDLEVIVNNDSEWLADRLVEAASRYADLTADKTIDPSQVYSDHSPFWDQGYPALLAIEDEPLRNPYYHQVTDTVDKLNIDFLAESTRAALALLAELAQPLKTGYPATPVGLRAVSEAYSSLFHGLQNVRLTWSGRADAAGYNIYRTGVSHLDYAKINTAPVAGSAYLDRSLRIDVPYYYVITAVRETGVESNFSREVKVEPRASAALDGSLSAGER